MSKQATPNAAPPATKPEILDDYLRRAGVHEAKLAESAPDVYAVMTAEEDLFAFIGRDVRRDLRYSQVFDSQQVDALERRGFVRLDTAELDIRVRGVPGGVIMARKRDVDAKAAAARQNIDDQRRHGTRSETRSFRPAGEDKFTLKRHARQVTVSEDS